jgi:hypothetical protein
MLVIPDPDVIGQWCVIHYDKSVYPVIIQDIDNESAEVNCMCSMASGHLQKQLSTDKNISLVVKLIIWCKPIVPLMALREFGNVIDSIDA